MSQLTSFPEETSQMPHRYSTNLGYTLAWWTTAVAALLGASVEFESIMRILTFLVSLGLLGIGAIHASIAIRKLPLDLEDKRMMLEERRRRLARPRPEPDQDQEASSGGVD